MKKSFNIFMFILVNIYKSIVLYKSHYLKAKAFENEEFIIKRTNHSEIKKILQLYENENNLTFYTKILWLTCPNLILHIYDKKKIKLSDSLPTI